MFSTDDFIHRRDTFFRSRNSALEAIERHLPSLDRSTSSQRYEKFSQLLIERATAPIVLVIGGSVEGGGMQPLLARCPPITLIDSDVAFGPRTKVVCDAHDLPFGEETFDGVVAQAVLEHVVDPQRCVDEIHRVLKKNGIVFAQTPFMAQVHSPYDFTRFTLLGQRRLFRRFSEIDSGATNGPGAALAWSWQYFLLSFASSVAVRAAVRAIARLTAFWLKYIDIYLEQRAPMLDAARGFYFIGAKGPRLLSDRHLVRSYRGGLRSTSCAPGRR